MKRAPQLAVRSQREGQTVLTSPTVGIWQPSCRPGSMVSDGDLIGYVHVLSGAVPVLAPSGVRGLVTGLAGDGGLRVPVEYGTELFALRAASAVVAGDSAAPESAAGSAHDVFRCPSSGRYYGRPGPDKEPFVRAGSTISRGDTVCLLEVMKTFNRIAFEGSGVPERATVVRVVPEDGADLGAGDVLLEIEPASV